MNEIVEAMKVVESCVVALGRLAWPSLCKAHAVLPCLGTCAGLGPGEPPSLTQNPFGPPNRRDKFVVFNGTTNSRKHGSSNDDKQNNLRLARR
jgi:hypothetical protein